MNKDNIYIGVYRHGDFNTIVNTPQEFALLKHFGQMLERGGSNVEIVAEVQRKKLAKNFWNVAFSSITTLTKYVPDSQQTNPWS